MIKRTVLSLFTALLFLFSSSSIVNAKSSFLDYLFQAPSLIRELDAQKQIIFEYIDLLQSLKETNVLAAESESNQEDVLADQTFVLQPTITPTQAVIVATQAPTRIPTDIPKPTRKPASTSESSYILSQINNFRQSRGLSTATPESSTCSFANLRARELASSFDHTGFSSRKDSGSLPYPSWSSVTENIAMNTNYKDVFNQWKNSSGHANNMLKDTPYICVRKYGSYYAMEGWKP